MIRAAAPASPRRARAILCAVAALTGGALIALVAGRDIPGAASSVAAVNAAAPAAAALPASVVSEAPVLRPDPAAEPRPAWQPPVAARARRDDGAAPARPQQSESPSFARDDWRASMADALDRKALEALPRDPGVMHAHVHQGEAAVPDARAPAAMLGATAPGVQGFDGWDGGKFWFGPQGLVRMKEAQP